MMIRSLLTSAGPVGCVKRCDSASLGVAELIGI